MSKVKRVDFTRRRKWLNLLFAGLIVYLVVILINQQSTIASQTEEIAGISSEIAALEEDNAVLKREIDLLHDDPAYIESIIRRELGLVRDSEFLYILPRWQNND